MALREAIRRIEREGLEKILKRTEALARYTRERLQTMGLELFAKKPSNGVTAVRVPAGVDGEKLLEFLRLKEGITLAGGQGEMRGEIFRIAHMGYIRKGDIDRALQALEKALRKQK